MKPHTNASKRQDWVDEKLELIHKIPCKNWSCLHWRNWETTWDENERAS